MSEITLAIRSVSGYKLEETSPDIRKRTTSRITIEPTGLLVCAGIDLPDKLDGINVENLYRANPEGLSQTDIFDHLVELYARWSQVEIKLLPKEEDPQSYLATTIIKGAEQDIRAAEGVIFNGFGTVNGISDGSANHEGTTSAEIDRYYVHGVFDTEWATKEGRQQLVRLKPLAATVLAAS